MRKSNSIFKTAFVSEAGAALKNGDYFAFVELDDFACYVLASEITDFETSEAAKDVVEHLIVSFQGSPSLKKSSLLRYMREANERLLAGGVMRRLEASVIMVVTDYENFRYVSAGNVRLRMYRQGHFFLKSEDMSLANDLIERGDVETPLDKHEERHNLYAYLGKEKFFKPFVSKTEKLADADIITIYSPGLWENVDELEIDEIFSEASDEPQETVDSLEEVLLSRQPKDLKSYTVATIFVNKVFQDPERERKRRLYIKAAIITLIIILIIALIVYIFHSWRQDKINNLEKQMTQTVEYMNAENFQRAQETCKTALDLADDLSREDDGKKLTDTLNLLDSIIQANDFFDKQVYDVAYAAYVQSVKFDVIGNKAVSSYIRRQLDNVSKHLDAEQFLQLGDKAFEDGELDAAEGMFLKARDKASQVGDSDRQAKAVAALEKLYDKKAQDQKDVEQKIADKKKAAMNDALKKGDELLAAGDLDGAQAAYLEARGMSDEPADRAITSAALEGVTKEKDKQEHQEKIEAEDLKRYLEAAKGFEDKGNEAYNAKDYLTAQMHYSQAIDAYDLLQEPSRANAAKEKYIMARDKFNETRGTKVQAEEAEQTARNNYADKNYTEAKAAAETAKQLYSTLGLKDKVADIDVLIEQIMADAAIDNALK